MSVIVSELYSYPVKSLRGYAQRSTRITNWGPDRDRRWVIVDARGQFVTQRQLPSMCRIAAEYRSDGIFLQNLDALDSGCFVAASSATVEREVTVWFDTCLALDGGNGAAEWLSRQLGAELRLCYMPDYTHRQVNLQFAEEGDRLGFADGFPFLLCNEASLQQLNGLLGRDLAMPRFRPNIVISGTSAFAEDQWRRIRIGEIEFDVVKPCARCAIPTVNLEDASREADVFRLLKKHRERDGEVFFGQNMIHRGQGQIKLGDAVDVVEFA